MSGVQVREEQGAYVRVLRDGHGAPAPRSRYEKSTRKSAIDLLEYKIVELVFSW